MKVIKGIFTDKNGNKVTIVRKTYKEFNQAVAEFRATNNKK